MIVPIIVLVMIIAGVFSYASLTEINRVNYTSRSQQLSETAAKTIDPHQMKTIRDKVMKIYHDTPDKVSNEEWGSSEYYVYLEKYN